MSLVAPKSQPQNVPLTDAQKLILTNIQRKILTRRVEISELEKSLQQELQKISLANNIAPSAQLDDDLNIISK